MHATEPEFRYRFWIIGALFAIGFFLYQVDHEAMASAMARLLHAPLRGVLFAGAALVVAAAALRTWAAAWLVSEVVHDERLRAERLVADGPYRRLRNPLYLGTILLGAGLGLVASRLGWCVITIGLCVFTQRLIGREEAALAASQGDSYRAYLSAVPSLVPSLRARLPPSGRRPRWGQAIGGEAFMWGFAAASVAYAVTTRWMIAGPLLVLAFVARFVSTAIERRRRG